MYRLVVLPVANTWMSWSLLHKLGITPGAAVVAGIGALVVVFLVLGVQVRARVRVCVCVCPCRNGNSGGWVDGGGCGRWGVPRAGFPGARPGWVGVGVCVLGGWGASANATAPYATGEGWLRY